MFDFAWSELALIAVVALVVIGPKDLPRVMRVVGQWVQRARAIAREFQGSLDQMVREAELDEMKKQFDRASSFNIERELHEAVDPGGEIQKSLNDPVLSNPLIEPPKPEATEPPGVTEPAAIEATPIHPEPLPVGEAKEPPKPEGEGTETKR
jgi:sec-independent protein translocase protein TatB